MKKYNFLIVFVFPIILSAQEKPVLRTVLSSDTVDVTSSFEIIFTLENGSIKKLNPPSFESFDVQGPSTMTSMSMVNGVKTQSASYSYYLTPKKTGTFTFEAASCETTEGTITSEKKTIVVLENYEAPKKKLRSQFGFFNDDVPDFFNVRPSQPKSQSPQKKVEKKPKFLTEEI